MVTQELIDYIKTQLEQGVSRDQIKQTLLSNGWQEADILKGFSAVESESHLADIANLEIKSTVNSAETTPAGTTPVGETPTTAPASVGDLAQSPTQQVALTSPEKPVTEPTKPETGLTELSTTEETPQQTQTETEPVTSESQPTTSSQPQPVSPPQEQPVVMGTVVQEVKKTGFNLKLNQSLLIALGALLGGIILGAGLVLGVQLLKKKGSSLPTSSPVSEVKTSPLSTPPILELVDVPYEDTVARFRFFYPVGWTPKPLSELEELGMNGVIFYSGGPASINIITLPLTPQDKQKPLSQLVDESIELAKKNYPDYQIINKSQTTVSGRPAFIVEGEGVITQQNKIRMRGLQLLTIHEAVNKQIVVTLMAPVEEWTTFQPLYWEALNSLELN